MIVERLAFEDPDIRYHSYHAAQHVVRYAAVRPIVAGKRVLDVACGEGYGARLLRDWGAREVVGVDLAPAAIAAAKRVFGDEGLSFLVGDVERLDKALDGVEPFDLIVSFETIEHLAHPERFLARLPGLLVDGGAIVISCPNDRAYSANHDNPYHLRTYTFEDFKGITQGYLGEASLWMLGAPLLGEMNFLFDDIRVREVHDSQTAIVDVAPVNNAVLIPAQSNLTTNEETCSHYIGLWGAELNSNAVISTLSVEAYHEVWNANSYLKERVKELEQAVLTGCEPVPVHSQTDAANREQQDAEVVRLNAVYANVVADNAVLFKRIQDELEPRLAVLLDENEALRREASQFNSCHEELRSTIKELEAEKAELSSRILADLEPRLLALADEVDTLQAKMARVDSDRLNIQMMNDRIVAENATLTREAVEFREVIDELTRVRSDLSESNSKLIRESAMFKAERDALDDRISSKLQPSIVKLCSENDEICGKLRNAENDLELIGRKLQIAEEICEEFNIKQKEYYEPELKRLREHIEHATFEKEVQLLRNRTMAYAERTRRAVETVATLERQLAEADEIRNGWFRPEIDRLNAIVAEYETTKRDWWVPQLEASASKIAELETACTDWFEPQLVLRDRRIAELEAELYRLSK